MAVIETQLVVLGAGPGGYAAAFLAADRGMKVTLIDGNAKPGGVCLHCGCISSKAFLHAAHLITAAHDAASFGITFAPPKIDIDVLRAKKNKIVETMSSHLAKLASERKVTYVSSRATFADSNTLTCENGTKVKFQTCILATGSSPTRIPTLNIDSPRVLDSTSALNLENVPASLLVIGGGYIGLEMGSVYAALGSKVTVVELFPSLLPGVDADLVRPLFQKLTREFANIYLSSKVNKLEDTGKGVKASLEGPEIKEPQQVFEKVLVSVGRRPNSKDLGLEKTGVKLDDKGFVTVDERRRTTDPNIYAIGDVAGEPMLAHKAAHEGKVAVEVILGEPAIWDPRAIPAVVFTDPEIAWAGMTENEAKKANREVKIARFHWAASGRATTLGRSDGMTKVIVDPETDRLLGIGLVGPQAGELVAEAVVALEMGATARDLAMCIHPHPTLSETIMESAEFLHGLATHLYRAKK